MARSYIEDDMTMAPAVTVPQGTDADIRIIASQYSNQAQRANDVVNLVHSSGTSTITASEYGIPLGGFDPTSIPVKGQFGLRVSTDGTYDPNTANFSNSLMVDFTLPAFPAPNGSDSE